MSVGVVAQIGGPEVVLDEAEIDAFIRSQLAALEVDGLAEAGRASGRRLSRDDGAPP